MEAAKLSFFRSVSEVHERWVSTSCTRALGTEWATVFPMDLIEVVVPGSWQWRQSTPCRGRRPKGQQQLIAGLRIKKSIGVIRTGQLVVGDWPLQKLNRTRKEIASVILDTSVWVMTVSHILLVLKKLRARYFDAAHASSVSFACVEVVCDLIDCLIDWFIDWLIDWLNHSFILSFVRLCINLFMHSFIHSWFIHPFIHSFTHSCHRVLETVFNRALAWPVVA